MGSITMFLTVGSGMGSVRSMALPVPFPNVGGWADDAGPVVCHAYHNDVSYSEFTEGFGAVASGVCCCGG